MEILSYLIDFFTDYGYISVFAVLIACGFGIPVPEDITLIASGVICALSQDQSHKLDIHIMAIVALIGVLLGDSIMFAIGRFLGPRVTRVKGLRFIITKEAYESIQDRANRYGDKVLFLARFLPGLRAALFLVAGVSHKVSFYKFIIMDGLAALISVPTLVYLGYFFANDLDKILNWVQHSEALIMIILFVGIASLLLYKWYKRYRSKIK